MLSHFFRIFSKKRKRSKGVPARRAGFAAAATGDLFPITDYSQSRLQWRRARAEICLQSRVQIGECQPLSSRVSSRLHLTRTSSAAATGSAAENLWNYFDHKNVSARRVAVGCSDLLDDLWQRHGLVSKVPFLGIGMIHTDILVRSRVIDKRKLILIALGVALEALKIAAPGVKRGNLANV